MSDSAYRSNDIHTLVKFGKVSPLAASTNLFPIEQHSDAFRLPACNGTPFIYLFFCHCDHCYFPWTRQRKNDHGRASQASKCGRRTFNFANICTLNTHLNYSSCFQQRTYSFSRFRSIAFGWKIIIFHMRLRFFKFSLALPRSLTFCVNAKT